MKLAIFAQLTALGLVFVPTVSSCGLTEIAGDVDGGVGGQTNVGGNTDVGGAITNGGAASTDVGGADQGVGGASTDVGGSPATSSVTYVPGMLPCDVLLAAGSPCVAAHSTVRAIVSGYTGPLYQLCKGTIDPGPNSCKGTATDIGSIDGYADAPSQNDFCSGETCFITKIYDQSGNHNDLEPAPQGGNKPTPDNPAIATHQPVTISGHTTYGVRIRAAMGYRTGCNDCNLKHGIGIPTGDAPETIFMVTSQKQLINGCCFDYGNAETTSRDDGNGAVEAVYFGEGVIWGTGIGSGPWVMADLENGTYAGWENNQDRKISTNTSLTYDYVTAVLVGDTFEKNNNKGRFALYGGDATSGALTTMYDGIRPYKPGYVPMAKQGSIILGTAGDNTAAGAGLFYEGAIATGAATQATVDALQASIVAAKYGQ